MPFQPQTLALTGAVRSSVVHDNADPAPDNIIRRTLGWHIHVGLDVAGALIPLLAGHHWHVDAMLESMGPGYEGKVGSVVLPIATPSTTGSFAGTITPPLPTTVPGLVAGVYKLVIVVTLHDATGTPLGLVGFDEVPMIQFYD
jgi:hypothetical protein